MTQALSRNRGNTINQCNQLEEEPNQCQNMVIDRRTDNTDSISQSENIYYSSKWLYTYRNPIDWQTGCCLTSSFEACEVELAGEIGGVNGNKKILQRSSVDYLLLRLQVVTIIQYTSSEVVSNLCIVIYKITKVLRAF